MHTVSLKHALAAGLLAALLGIAGPLAVPAARAFAETGESTSGGSTTSSTTSSSTTTASTTIGDSTSSSATSGGAAPTPGSPGRQTVATWYGPGFYGHTTACGQKLTPKLVGLASRTLACGTLVRISYGGHLLTAPVLDRGPYGHSGAVWDLTSGAARALEIKETVRIGTQVVGSVPNTPTLGQAPFSTTLSPATPTSASAQSESPAGSSSATPGSAATGGASAS
ncbi:MAG TPA: septal ring lytic transglycosylase RlpA family protein [Solirubrobacteraceae bacterium]|jgi:rare lipoprotein A (peptidoglycan hydrolase)|nr:septal ring lytic transglycosylase RlpA family protein [Solirubrobacteraceae bacterium]